ncbi:MAG: ribosome biogenesis GTPase YlqF [Candidatus Lambdaproteobacteria bacterium]|nr:ribosome biogenesis GTPase YlqF [Candidatus Lambdaproteobacteria bacterium]
MSDQPDATNISWFPGHMHKAQQRLARELPQADVILEVRDARIPLLSGNAELQSLFAGRRRLVLCNKSRLADASANRRWHEHLLAGGVPNLFLDADAQKSTNLILPLLRELLAADEQKYRRRKMRPPLYRLMVVGMPNVGKSTLINRLVRKHKLATAPTPGVTRDITWTNLRERYLLADSPGIMLPRLPDERTALMLGWIGTIRDHVIGEERLAVSLLGHLGERALLGPVQACYGLPPAEVAAPVELLAAIATQRGFLRKGAGPDLTRAAREVLADFRAGRFGRITLEQPPDPV